MQRLYCNHCRNREPLCISTFAHIVLGMPAKAKRLLVTPNVRALAEDGAMLPVQMLGWDLG